jgi:dienelactone hydrolase
MWRNSRGLPFFIWCCLCGAVFLTTPLLAQLIDQSYPQQPVPPAIQQQNQQRRADYLQTLLHRREQRQQRLVQLTTDKSWQNPADRKVLQNVLDVIRNQLSQSLGITGIGVMPEVHSTISRRWGGRTGTREVEVDDRMVTRTSRGRQGMLERVHLRTPTGGNIELLLAKDRRLTKPYRVVICVPGIDDYTHRSVGAGTLIGEPAMRAMTDAGLLVVAATLPSLKSYSEHSVKLGLLEGRPLPGQIAAEISAVITWLQQRDDIVADRIGVYGQGLGGFGALLAASMDTRIWAAAVESGLPMFQSVINANEHLRNEWLVPRMLTFTDGPELTSLVAPRPLLVSAGNVEHLGRDAVLQSLPAIIEPAYGFYEAVNNVTLQSAQSDNSAVIAEFFTQHLKTTRQPWEQSISVDTAPSDNLDSPTPVVIAEIQSPDQWQQARSRILAEVSSLFGGFPDRGVDHSGTLLARGREKDFTWEYVAVRTTPQHVLPVIITRSENVPQRAPAIMHISGHSTSPESDVLRLAGEMATHGFMGVFVNQKAGTGFDLGGTRPSAIGILEGRPLLGDWAWNLMGVIDYLETRPDIDADRLGATGWSMGATTLNYFLPFEPRIKAAAGFVAFTQLRGMAEHHRTGDVDVPDGGSFLEAHPLYNQVPGLLRVCDADELLATFVPRPLLSLAGTRDEYFPHQLVRQAFGRTASIYELLGLRDRADQLVAPGPHGLLPPLRERAWKFFKRWLQ